MTADPRETPQFETAYVLFMDLVGYSAVKDIEDQLRLVEELREVVRRALEAAGVPAGEDMVRLPTGDGMALVFFRNPIAPVRCAMEISRAVRDHPRVKLRMGLH